MDYILFNTVKKLIIDNKGILAADESINTIGKRFKNINVDNTVNNRRDYRFLLFTTPDHQQYISGVILFEETLYQTDIDRIPLVNNLLNSNILLGIKVDKGLEKLSNNIEHKTNGLNDLEERCIKFFESGVRFSKWRNVFNIDTNLNYPSDELLEINTTTLAQYAQISLKSGLVPLIEPEVLMVGDFSMETYSEVTKKVLKSLFIKINELGLNLKHIILKINMIVPSSQNKEDWDEHKIAKLTYETLIESVPKEIPGIVFLSGGQSEDQSCLNLKTICQNYPNAPWKLSFSFGRALQASALQAWKGKVTNIQKAKTQYLLRAEKASSAITKV